MTKAVKSAFVALDIGGTKTVCAVSGADGELSGLTRVPTNASAAPDEVLDGIARVFSRAVAASGVDPGRILGAGVGVPTTLDYESGLIDASPNLPTMSDYPLGNELSSRIGLPVTLENDAGCFILGEVERGAAAGARDCCGITLGTGFGLGVMLGGKLHRGAHGTAGEVWNCPFGKGIFEHGVSGTAVSRRYLDLTGIELDGARVAERARSGDTAAGEVFHAFGEDLGGGISWLVNLLDPQVVVLGGSAAMAWDLFSGPMLTVVGRHRIGRNRTRIVRSALGETAALYGAAWLARNAET
jgi:glucokinase